MAVSKSNIWTDLRLNRAAVRAASFTMLARSAPEKPGVPRASTLRLTSLGHRHLLRVHAENLFAALDVRAIDDHAAIEAPRTQQRGIKHIGAIGRGDQDDAVVGLEAVHLNQELVEGLLAFVVSAA